MTIFRVNTDRDEAKIVEVVKEDRVLKKALEQWKKTREPFAKKIASDAPKLIKASRAVYTAADKQLKELSKDKQGKKEQIKSLTKIRKTAYDTTVVLQKLMKS